MDIGREGTSEWKRLYKFVNRGWGRVGLEGRASWTQDVEGSLELVKFLGVEEKGERINFAVLFRERREKQFAWEFFILKILLLILGLPILGYYKKESILFCKLSIYLIIFGLMDMDQKGTHVWSFL